MGSNPPVNPVFHDEEFWLKISVDYPEALEEAGENASSLPEKLLGRFLRGKRKVVSNKYDSVKDFKREVKESGDAEGIIFSIYVESLWMKNWSEGVEFEHVDGTVDDLVDKLDEDTDYQDVNETFGVIWPTTRQIRRKKEEGEVIGVRSDETEPVVVKKDEDSIMVRASSARLKSTTRDLRDTEEIVEVEPESEAVEISPNIQGFLSNTDSDFEVIGVKFNDSELPERSRIRVKHERSIVEDLGVLSEVNIISTEGVSAIQKIYLRDTRFGGKYRVKLNHADEGFRFELVAPEKLQRERERFKNRFKQETGVSFGVEYEYGSQNQRHLFNRVLSGDGGAYDRYFDELDEDLRRYAEEFTDATYQTQKLCFECREAVSDSLEVCSRCGSTDFSDSFEQVDISINESRVAYHVNAVLEEREPVLSDFEISRWSVEQREMNSRDIVRSDFTSTAFEERGSPDSTRHEVFFVPQGNQIQPRQINNYLLKCVYVTYGESAVDDYEGFGRISLYELLTTENPEKLVGKSIHDAVMGMQVRTFSKANEAFDVAEDYLRLVSEHGYSGDTSELEEYYNPDMPDYFEKHVFYLLKGLFVQTERWGRHTKREADALLVVPRPGSRKAYAAKVDPKLSHSDDGYPLGTSGEDQVSRYMTNGQSANALRSKTGREQPDALVLVSQNFNSDRFALRSRGVQERLENGSDDYEPDLVFMEYEALVELYQLELDYHRALDNPDVKRRFRELVIEELQNVSYTHGAKFVHFDGRSVKTVRDGLLAEAKAHDIDPVRTYSQSDE
ncbi:hypothetical protein OB955_14525 [Halobacteria archaeon AArc-m2/3/4]|uniref:Uncharacterized protein n=1 Tax=Natronoglomus mannanivorans TaxID=2979990 RepID=A0ABT2QGA8_9EURY|nr:hypothetical protein [Halobacteria archaeon AArc-m2/3/4]